MKQYLIHDEWSIIEEGFHKDYNKISESNFSIGNGKFGQRGNFEEYFSGETLVGNYISGIYYPDKTKVGWWKNGYPEYFAKVLNAPNWTGIKTKVNGEKLDPSIHILSNFKRALDMKDGMLSKSYDVDIKGQGMMSVSSERFTSMHNDELAVINYKIKSVSVAGTIEILLDMDGDISNADSNYDEKFWIELDKSADKGTLTVETKKTAFKVGESMAYEIYKNGLLIDISPEYIEKMKYIGHSLTIEIDAGDEIIIYKYIGVCSSLYHERNFGEAAKEITDAAVDIGYETLKDNHIKVWHKKWAESDIVIKGDVAAQQGIRFNIFQLHQTYTGKDPRLNIGPKGLTGEKYGGSTYWDTEAYCLPFYMSSADKDVSLNLLKYRYNHLEKAIENAAKLGFVDGAALYPMVTMNGEESHNEWEITFEEIHRNGAIAYAIFNYIRYFDDDRYLVEGGLEVLIAIARFWAQRVNFSESKKKYVMLGVTGPNEYENNVNNNWYTNKIATWCLSYAHGSLEVCRNKYPEETKHIIDKINIKTDEIVHWNSIVDKMYYPKLDDSKIFLQQDGFMDKELRSASDLPEDQVPLHENWSWDRILRSCYIKQADVLQGLWFLEHEYDKETIKANFEFYEPMTVHESSLSSCIHAIQASLLGKRDTAYKFYLNAARLDLDDYNNDSDDGLHITSMGGTWMVITYGFAGMRIKENKLSFDPSIPKEWDSITFNLSFRGNVLEIELGKEQITFENTTDREINILVQNKEYKINALSHKKIDYEM